MEEDTFFPVLELSFRSWSLAVTHFLVLYLTRLTAYCENAAHVRGKEALEDKFGDSITSKVMNSFYYELFSGLHPFK